MRFYLDDDLASRLIQRLLIEAGHELQVPAQVGMGGEDDAVHLTRAIRDKRVLLSGNHDDFENLHDLVIQAGGHHSGILVVRRDNDPNGISHLEVSQLQSATWKPLALTW